MHKIVKILDKNKNEKREFFTELKELHPDMTGKILHSELIGLGSCFCFAWSDEPERMLRTSGIEQYENTNGNIRVETRNSIYYLEPINE